MHKLPLKKQYYKMHLENTWEFFHLISPELFFYKTKLYIYKISEFSLFLEFAEYYFSNKTTQIKITIYWNITKTHSNEPQKSIIAKHTRVYLTSQVVMSLWNGETQ